MVLKKMVLKKRFWKYDFEKKCFWKNGFLKNNNIKLVPNWHRIGMEVQICGIDTELVQG